MTYLSDESSVADAKPVELFKFEGTYASYFYTSGPKIVNYDDEDYIPIAIERSEVKGGTQDDDGLDITVTLPVTEVVVQDYGFTVSPPKLKLTIYRQEPSETIVYWTGPVNNFSVPQSDNGRASVRCPSALGAALVGNIPDVYYQTPCNHTLYDPRCGVDYASNSNVTSVTGISADGKVINVASIGGLNGKLNGGELALGTGEVRMIVSQTGTALTVNFPFARITVGGAATIAAGCDYAYTGDCKGKFANQGRFGGFNYIPPINPFIDGIEPAEDGVTDDACIYPRLTFDGWYYKVWIDVYNSDDGGEVRNDGHYNIYHDGANVADSSGPAEYIGGYFSELVNYGMRTGVIFTINTEGSTDRPRPWSIQEQHTILVRPAGNGLYNIPNLFYNVFIRHWTDTSWTEVVTAHGIGGVFPHYSDWSF